jgi:dTDP-4-dehydrorhamnose 3,5-epimerase
MPPPGVLMLDARKDPQTVTADGQRVERLIEGVVVRNAVTHEDDRGELSEIFNPAWGVTSDPLVYVYQAMIRPGKLKGWVYHEHQEDRIFLSCGFLKWVLCDLREDSPTYKMINEITMSERNRKLLVIPRRVAHAAQNIGLNDAMFVNMPTRAYNHGDPDKFRIDIDSGAIPYRFESKPGW